MLYHLMGQIQGHATKPDQPDPNWDRGGGPAHDARVHPLCRPHVLAQIPGLEVPDHFHNKMFSIYFARQNPRGGIFTCVGPFHAFPQQFLNSHSHCVHLVYTSGGFVLIKI